MLIRNPPFSQGSPEKISEKMLSLPQDRDKCFVSGPGMWTDGFRHEVKIYLTVALSDMTSEKKACATCDNLQQQVISSDTF